MGTGRQYDEEFKKQAIKLGKEVGLKATPHKYLLQHQINEKHPAKS